MVEVGIQFIMVFLGSCAVWFLVEFIFGKFLINKINNDSKK
jgi:hypothetical protein